MKNIKMNKVDFEYVFFDDINIHGYQLCGIAIHEFNNEYNHEVHYKNVFNVIPENIKSNKNNFLIKSDNLKSYIINHILMLSETDKNNYLKLIDIIKKHEPEKINNDNYIKHIKCEYIDEFADNIFNQLIETAEFSINNQKIIAIDFDKFNELQIKLIENYYKQ